MFSVDPNDLAQWDEISANGLTPQQRARFDARRRAVAAVSQGLPISVAAKKHGVNCKTLRSTITNAMAVAPDGKPWGWRACFPNRVRNPTPITDPTLPEHAGPGAFSRFLKAAPSFEALLRTYDGPLPGRNSPSAKFEKFFGKWRSAIKSDVPPGKYPRNDPAFARRSCIEHIRSLRIGFPFTDTNFEAEDCAAAGQLADVFALQLTDWVQYDGHRSDCEFAIAVSVENGADCVRKLTATWLLAGLIVYARLPNSWKISFGTNYNGTDFNEVCSNSLRSWEPRDLVSDEMQYKPGSGIGTYSLLGHVVSGAITSLDNAMAHRLDVNRQRLATELLGVVNFGRSKVPESRGHLEAWNKQVEENLIRKLPGSFRPATASRSSRAPTSGYSAEDHPVQIDILEDLFDVVLSAISVTEMDTLQKRTPYEVIAAFAAAGGWMFSTSDHDSRAAAMSRLRVKVVIKGSKVEGRQPYVRFKNARYRSVALKNRWDLVGNTFTGIVDIHDARYLNLYTAKGELFVILRAVRPWSRTKHSLALRALIYKGVNRDLLTINGADDAVAVYRNHLRSLVRSSAAAVTTTVQHREALSMAKEAKPEDKGETTDAGASALKDVFIPLTGRVHLGKRRP